MSQWSVFRTRTPYERYRYSKKWEGDSITGEGANLGGTPGRGRSLNKLEPQAYIDHSADNRKGLRSLFAYGKRAVEADAYTQAHLSVSGIPGVVRLAVLDAENRPIPFAPFEWGGRKYHTDASGSFVLVEKQFFQNSISVENERSKYVTQMISLVVGQPAENVIALFGLDFYDALGAHKADEALNLYQIYMAHAGLKPDIIRRKALLFANYADGECSPEVMCNYGDNDPQWSKAFNKLCMLIEYHPSAILFDEGHLDPTDASGRIGGDLGRNNMGSLPVDEFKSESLDEATRAGVSGKSEKFIPDSIGLRRVTLPVLEGTKA